MKKNAVGRILYQKVPVKSRFESWHIPAEGRSSHQQEEVPRCSRVPHL